MGRDIWVLEPSEPRPYSLKCLEEGIFSEVLLLRMYRGAADGIIES